MINVAVKQKHFSEDNDIFTWWVLLTGECSRSVWMDLLG